MEVRLAAPMQKDSIIDGEGIRTVIWFQGCRHNCFGCHNPETHDFEGGIPYDTKELKKELKSFKYQQGITLSGGDPFFQAAGAAELAKYAHEIGLNVWTYTGYTYDELIKENDSDKMELLKNTDVLVDGRFVLNKKSLNVRFRGSTNQRVIDVAKSLASNEVVLYYED